jgi:D-alanyl-D-alanine carboxypeptidase
MALLAMVLAGCGGTDAPGSDGVATEETLPIDLRTFRRVTEGFRGTLETIVQERGLPGAVAAFILPDGRVGAASSGLADTEAQLTMSPETRFLAGSVGKTFVAATVLSLVHEGAVELDAPVSRYLGEEPWYGDLPNGSVMTVRHLLTHTSGLPDHVYDPYFGPALLSQESATPYLLPRELVGFVLDDEPLFPAGRGWAYTDTGYVLLGLIIEQVTGRGYADVLETRLLDPLELVRTEAQKQAIPRLAAGYLASDNPLGLPEKILQDGALLLDPWTEYTGGGLVSNPQDLVRWAKALYEGEAMDAPYLDELLGSAVSTDSMGSSSYGLGVSIQATDLGLTYGHTGWFPGYNTLLAYYPDHGLAVAFQTNTDTGVDLGAARDALVSALLGELGLVN